MKDVSIITFAAIMTVYDVRYYEMHVKNVYHRGAFISFTLRADSYAHLVDQINLQCDLLKEITLSSSLHERMVKEVWSAYDTCCSGSTDAILS